MLRSVVGVMAANMMLVQCNSGVPISLACLTWSASVLSTASPEPRPVGTSMVRSQAGSSLETVALAGKKHRNIEAEVGVILPHPVQDHGDTPRQRSHRALGTTTARKFCGPGSQPTRPPAMHHYSCRLAQGTAEIDVTCLCDPSRDASFARLASRGRQVGPRPNLLRRNEAVWDADRRSIGQRHNCANAGHRHLSATANAARMTTRRFPANMACSRR